MHRHAFRHIERVGVGWMDGLLGWGLMGGGEWVNEMADTHSHILTAHPVYSHLPSNRIDARVAVSAFSCSCVIFTPPSFYLYPVPTHGSILLFAIIDHRRS
jgi:hypothetical protein